MITVRRAAERGRDRQRGAELWLTFERAPAVALAGFDQLALLDEDRLAPGAGVPSPIPGGAEVVTYVRAGALAYRDSTGCSGVLHAGEFQRVTGGPGVRHRESNPSRAEWTHVMQVGLRAAPTATGAAAGYEQRRFSAAERRGVLCVVASPDARRGSLRLHQDATLYSAMLAPGHHVVHALGRGRSAWLHLVEGEAALGDLVLSTGDGAGVTAERALSLTARAATEILLVDVAERG